MDARTALSIVTGVAIAAAVLAIFVAWFLTRDFSIRAQDTTRAARELEAGTLPDRLAGSMHGPPRGLTEALDDLIDALATHVRSVEAERAHLAAVLSHMADGVVIADRNGIIEVTNPAAARLLELTPSWAEGHPALAMAQYPELVALVRDVLAGEPERAVPRLLELGPAGKRRVIQAVASSLPASSRSGPRVLVMLQDVTELRRAEAARRELVANVSHELRTPVAALKALVETLQAGALEDGEVAREFLGRMDIEVDGLAQLIEELLELARVEAGQVAIRRQLVDVGPVVAAAAERLRPQAERQGLELIVTPSSGLPPAQADPERIQQVVVNLIHNAIKFTPPGGAIVVSVDEESPGDDRREIVVRIADTGIGIASDALPRLFERFYKVDRARSSGGTGLGLAIAKHVVQAHGGRIWAESPGEGQGATFCFTLPTAVHEG